VLIRACRLPELTLGELTEVVQDAWLARASPRRQADWLAAHSSEERPACGSSHGRPRP